MLKNLVRRTPMEAVVLAPIRLVRNALCAYCLDSTLAAPDPLVCWLDTLFVKVDLGDRRCAQATDAICWRISVLEEKLSVTDAAPTRPMLWLSR